MKRIKSFLWAEHALNYIETHNLNAIIEHDSGRYWVVIVD